MTDAGIVLAWFAASMIALFVSQIGLVVWLSRQGEPPDFLASRSPVHLARKYREVRARQARPERGVVALVWVVSLSTLLSAFFLIGLSGRSS